MSANTALAENRPFTADSSCSERPNREIAAMDEIIGSTSTRSSYMPVLAWPDVAGLPGKVDLPSLMSSSLMLVQSCLFIHGREGGACGFGMHERSVSPSCNAHEVLVIAYFHDLAVFEKGDLICTANGREPMGY